MSTLAPTPTPAAVAAGDTGAAAVPAPTGLSLPTATPLGGSAGGETNSVTDQLGQSLSMDRLRTQFLNGIRISAAVFIGLAALFAGKRLFEWVWKKYG